MGEAKRRKESGTYPNQASLSPVVNSILHENRARVATMRKGIPGDAAPNKAWYAAIKERLPCLGCDIPIAQNTVSVVVIVAPMRDKSVKTISVSYCCFCKDCDPGDAEAMRRGSQSLLGTDWKKLYNLPKDE